MYWISKEKIKVLNYFWGIIFGKTFLLLVICVSAISWMKRDHLALFIVYIFKTIWRVHCIIYTYIYDIQIIEKKNIHFNIKISTSFDFYIRNIAQCFVVVPKPSGSCYHHFLSLHQQKIASFPDPLMYFIRILWVTFYDI